MLVQIQILLLSISTILACLSIIDATNRIDKLEHKITILENNGKEK